MKYILYLSLFLMTACFEAPESKPSTPTKFNAFIGGLLGSSYKVDLKDGQLLYRTDKNWKNPVKRNPSEESWRLFRAEMDAADIWNWNKTYVDDEVLDGTQWSVTITYPDKSIETHGSNEYPDMDSFNRVMKAIENLTKKPFR